MQALLEKIRGIIKTHRGATAKLLIFKLNPIIRGWANYHRHIAAKATFAKVDHAIHEALVRWARRRHPGKSWRWLGGKTFPDGHGSFSAPVEAKDGTKRLLRLHRAAGTKIERHIKVRAEATPYDPRYTEYFARRRSFAWRVYVPGKTALPKAAPGDKPRTE